MSGELTGEHKRILLDRVKSAEWQFHKLRRTLHRVEERIEKAKIDLDGMWLHHQDGSDLLVDKGELFDIVFNYAMKELRNATKEIKKRKEELAEYIKNNGDIPTTIFPIKPKGG